MKKIVLAFDSFKGSLTSKEVADAFEKGLLCVAPDAQIQKVCIADGGEGTMAALMESLGGEYVDVEVCNPLGRKIIARYAVVDGGKTAVIEMAQASGLTLLSAEERNPLATSTYGTGQIVADAIMRGCRKLLVCIGGSATNDGGTGMLTALGYRFVDAEGRELIGCGANLSHIVAIDGSLAMAELKNVEFIVACDVKNPLYGINGAAYVFAAQKGADEDMIRILDEGLRNYSEALARYCGRDVSQNPSAGAAGGMGAGMMAILDARMQAGVEMVLDAVDFDKTIGDAQLIVTGEGKLDRQTMMGKAPAGVLARARACNIPVVAVGGGVEWCDELRQAGFARILSATPADMPLAVAMQHDVAINNVKATASTLITSHPHNLTTSSNTPIA